MARSATAGAPTCCRTRRRRTTACSAPHSSPGRLVNVQRDVLRETASYAAEFLGSLDERPVFPRASVEELRAALGGRLPERGLDPADVVAELTAAAEPGIVGIPSGRYFGFVIGGALPAALAADWLTSTWDQNAGIYPIGPSASVVEQVARDWLLELLGLPGEASIGFVTGTQLAHVTGL